MNIQIEKFFNSLGNKKKIIEIKIGEKISNSCFHNRVDGDTIRSIFEKFQNYNVKYFNNKVYYYNNLQLIVYSNGSKKCYKDNMGMEKIDVQGSKDIRITSKDREKVEEILFPCKKNYDLIFRRELISISVKNNLKINLYHKHNEDNTTHYDFSIQYLYNPSKKNNINDDIDNIVNICNSLNKILIAKKDEL
tara:strand:+ start:222 stop:797 length:576 start_codon:yes stop_codon:yes gene_type:complete